MKISRNQASSKTFQIIPIIITLGFLPLIVHMYHYDAGWENLAWFPTVSNDQNDFFLGWKSIAVIIVAVIMIGILLYEYRHKRCKIQTEPLFFLLLIYGLFVLMSALFSPYKPQVFTGSYEVLQPVWGILGYLIICFYTYQFSSDEKALIQILAISGIGLGIMLLIGFFQFIGVDLFQTTVGKFLIANPSWWKQLDLINFSFGKHTVYTTLYNPDFLSFYFGMIIPVLAAMFFVVKRTLYKIIILIAEVMSVVCIIGAGASSGYLSVAIAVAAGIYLFLSRKKKTWIIGNTIVVASVVLGICLCMTTSAGSHLQSLFVGTQRSVDQHALRSIETTDDGINLDINGNPLTISYMFDSDTESATVLFMNGNGEYLPSEIITTDTGSAYSLNDASYADCQVEPIYVEDLLCIRVSFEDKSWYFTNQTDGTYYYYNPIGKLEKIAPVKKSTLFYDDAMSGRGNLWNLIIPKLPSHIFMGAGANSFARVFPQNDYVYKVYNGLDNVFAVKAHNWFLQEWIENGLIGTLCLFGFYLWYMITSIRLYHKCKLDNATAIIGFGIFIGTIGYMAASIVNDANVATAPVYWGMMGLGLAANRMIKQNEQK